MDAEVATGFGQGKLPAYDAGGLAGVLPAVLRSLGVAETGHGAGDHDGRRDLLDLPQARRAVVVLIDGLGYDLLGQRSGHAPFLRGLLPAAHRLSAGFPSTTATSSLPFTGLEAGLIAAAGLGLAGTGLVLRRAARDQA